MVWGCFSTIFPLFTISFLSLQKTKKDAVAIGAILEIIRIFEPIKKQTMKFVKLLFVCAVVLSLQSCKITESVLINEDGSGRFNYEMDASPLMEIGDSFGDAGSEKRKSKKSKKATAQRKKEVIDSTFSFKELFASKQDSIASLPQEEQERIKKMENLSMRIQMNEESKLMSYSLFSNFKTIDELKDMTSPVKTIKESGAAADNGMSAMVKKEAQENSTTSYFYDGKVFRRTVSDLESKGDSKQTLSEEPALSEEDAAIQKVADELGEAMKEVLGKSSYKVVYTFAKPVKKVSIPNAVISEDKKTVTVDYLFEDYMKKPKSLDLEIEFE